MDFLDLAKKRYSCRAYETRPVEREKIDRIVQAAHVAPTAGNRQPARLLVVDDEEGLAKLAQAGRMHGAPLAIVACVDRERAWHRPSDGAETACIDASILVDHMMMEATDLGLGTCWICWFDPAVVAEAFALPETFEPVSILVAGYAADVPASPNRHAAKRIPADELLIGRR